MKKILLILNKPGLANASLLAQKMVEKGNTYAVFYRPFTWRYDTPKFRKFIKNENVTYVHKDNLNKIQAMAKKADHLLAVTETAWSVFKNLGIEKKWETKALICTEGHFVRKSAMWCKIIQGNNIIPYIMPALDIYAKKLDYIPYCPPIDLTDIPKLDKDLNLILHGPSTTKNVRKNRKGTQEINKAVRSLLKIYPKFKYNLVSGISWEKNIHLKSAAGIFIDQILKNNPNTYSYFSNKKKPLCFPGGIGKAGYEAMFLGCLTITSGDSPDMRGYFPAPPALWTDLPNFKNTLIQIIQDQPMLIALAKEQQAWAETYLDPQFVIKNITRHI